MQNITLPQYVKCESNQTKFVTKINCTHWEFDSNNTCTAHCKLKNFTAAFPDCFKCKERDPITKTQLDPSMFANPIQQIKSRLPQYNYYSKDNLEKVISEEQKEEMAFMDKAKSYTKAEASQMFNGKVSEEIYNKRKQICLGCPKKSNHSPQTEEIGWCLSCGCNSKNPRAALSNKLWMPSLECPLKKFGKEVGTGFNASDAIDSVKGAMQSIGSLFKKEEENGKENKEENT